MQCLVNIQFFLLMFIKLTGFGKTTIAPSEFRFVHQKMSDKKAKRAAIEVELRQLSKLWDELTKRNKVLTSEQAVLKQQLKSRDQQIAQVPHSPTVCRGTGFS